VNDDGDAKPETDAGERIVEDCIAACAACAAEAERCAAICLQAEKTRDLARVISLARTCADVCLLTSRLLAQQSEFLQEYCALCAEVCHTLREECLKQPSVGCCARCAAVALRCDRACQKAAV
jgi:hypothetical protein